MFSLPQEYRSGWPAVPSRSPTPAGRIRRFYARFKLPDETGPWQELMDRLAADQALAEASEKLLHSPTEPGILYAHVFWSIVETAQPGVS